MDTVYPLYMMMARDMAARKDDRKSFSPLHTLAYNVCVRLRNPRVCDKSFDKYANHI